MATVTLGGTPTTIDLAEAITNWGGDTFLLEPDIKVQGSNSVACAMTATGNNDGYVTGTWDFSGTGLGDQHLRLWFNISFIGNLSATNPIQIFLYDGTNTAFYYWDKAASYSGGWAQAVIYTGNSPDSGSVTKSSITRIGMRFVTSSKPRNVPANAWFDAWRYGDGYYATGGTSGDEIDLDLIAADDLTNAYGIVTKVDGNYSVRGDLQIGNGSTTTWFKSDGDLVTYAIEQVNAGLYKFHGNGAGCRIDVADSVFKAEGTAAKDKFDFDMSETNLLSTSIVDTQIVGADTVDFKSSQTATGNIYNGCGQINHSGADMDNSTVKNYSGASNTSAMLYDVAGDPDGELDDSSFTMGTTETHAIEFGTTSPLSMTLRGIDASGYDAGATPNQNDSPLHFKRTSGTIAVALVDCTGINADGYRTDGATVNITAAKVATFTPLENGSAFTITKDSDNSVLKDVASVTGGEVVYSYDGSLDGTATTVHIIIAGKEPIDFAWTIAEGTVPISQITDRVYST